MGVDVGIGLTFPRVRSEIDLVVGVGVGGKVDDGTGVEVGIAFGICVGASGTRVDVGMTVGIFDPVFCN